MPLYVLNVVQLGSQRILDINDDDLPVGLAFIQESHDAENLDLFDLANVAYLLANLTDIERVVVTLGLGLSVGLRGVLPGLRDQIRSSPMKRLGATGTLTWGNAP